MSAEDTELLLRELAESSTATQLDDGGLWMRTQAQSRDALPRRRDKQRTSSSSKRASASDTDARHHGNSLVIVRVKVK